MGGGQVAVSEMGRRREVHVGAAREGVRRFGRKRFLRRQKIEMVIAWPLAVLCFAGLRAQGCP